MLKNMLRKLKLSSKLAVTIGGTLTLIFVILILSTISMVKKSISATTFGELTVLSRSNAIQIQQVFDAAESVAVDMENYYETMYSENKEQLFFLFEGPGEKEAVDRVAKHALKAGADFRIIHKKLEEYKKMISICDVMICNDSGAAHISAAYGVPTIVVFGCNPPEFSCPVGKGKFSFLSLDLPCKPCLSDTCLTGRLDCIYGIKVNDVKRAVEEIYQYGICKEE